MLFSPGQKEGKEEGYMEGCKASRFMHLLGSAQTVNDDAFIKAMRG